MVSISTGAFTTWEMPWSIQTPASQLKSHAESFASHVEQADSHWAGLPAAYTGPSEQTLFSALSPAKVSADFIRNAGVLAETALGDFATGLQTLRQQRSALVADIESFNSAHADTAEEDLDPLEHRELYALRAEVDRLQAAYENLVSNCAELLGHIKSGEVYGDTFSSTEQFDGFPVGWNDFTDVAGWWDVETTHTWQGTETEIFDPRTGQTTLDPSVTNTSPAGTSTNLTLFDAPLGSVASTVGGSSLMGTVGSAMRNDRSPGATWQDRMRNGFKGRFLDGLPGAADYRAWSQGTSPSTTTTAGDPRYSTGSDGTSRSERTVTNTRSTNALGNNLNRLATGGGSVATAVMAGNQFLNEREMRQQQLAEENPGMSDEEVNSEATHDAAAHTVGSAGSSILASAAVGAGVGSAVPVAGTAIGFGAGLVTGVVMEAPLLPDVTGDGTRDSVAGAIGHYAEQGWEWVRNDGVDAVKDVGSDIADGAGDLVDSAKESNLNPMNWFD